jgi:GNAT superfamily N-acetyltransferase
MSEVAVVTEIVRSCEIQHWGEATWTAAELEAHWQGLRPPMFAWVAELPGKGVVGYASCHQDGGVRFRVDADVHPDHVGLGVGSALVDLLEDYARGQIEQAPPGARVSITSGVGGPNQLGRSLLESRGYAYVRCFFEMVTEIQEAPRLPTWPEGVSPRPYCPALDERELFGVLEGAFQDHWGYLPETFEQWRRRVLERDSFDPTLCHLAMSRERIVGASLCDCFYSEDGWVSELGVLRDWRHRGIGMALLLHSFGEFHRRGLKRARLGVDAESITGALRLYERAGMRVSRRFDAFEKELRPGRELSRRS